MDCPAKLLLLLVITEGPLFFASGFAFTNNSPLDWKKINTYNDLMKSVCHECDSLCPRSPYPASEAEKTEIQQQWACYVGCRSTCLLQAGPEKHTYEASVSMCANACHNQFVPKGGEDNNLSSLCVEACAAKVGSLTVPPTASEPLRPEFADEQEIGPFDPALSEPYPQSGGLPHSNYKTLPHHDVRQRPTKTPVEYFLNFIKDPATDPFLAGVTALFMFAVIVIGIAAYYVILSRRPQYFKENANDILEELNVLTIEFQPDSKKGPPPANFLDEDDDDDDEFVPPLLPPPKYYEELQNV